MKSIVAVLVLILLPVAAHAQEEGAVDNPTPADITVKSIKIISFAQQRLPDWRFVIIAEDNNGKQYLDEHIGLYHAETNPKGADRFLKQMNTMNFATTSMVKRLLEHIESEGIIPPITVVGTPEPPTTLSMPKPPPPPVIKKDGRGGR
jgi:hypothetical protein